MNHPIYTIGHSNRTLAEFIELLHESEIKLVVDVRRLPGSTRYPQFNEDTLSEALAGAGIGFRRAEGLSGRRPASKAVPFDVNGWWENRSFHNYADHALSETFHRALADLREWGATSRTAVMCSEAVWWRCHRRIITDYLLAHDERVFHILGSNQVQEATLSPGAVVGDDRRVTYPSTR